MTPHVTPRTALFRWDSATFPIKSRGWGDPLALRISMEGEEVMSPLQTSGPEEIGSEDKVTDGAGKPALQGEAGARPGLDGG